MAEPLLVTSGLSRGFGALKACDDVNLDIRAGEIHALIGPNGAGKSTFVKLVSGEIGPDTGSIHLLGKSVETLPMTARAGLGMARSFQVSALAPSMSGLEHVVLALLPHEGGVFHFLRPVARERELRDRAGEMLARVGMLDRAEIPVAGLSHGERRQLEIAIALALEPRVLLLDEPMAGMGPEGSARLAALLNELRGDMGILLIEHDMDTVFALADRISVMVGGRIVATGNADEIRSDETVKTAYLGETP
ncbi:MAG: ABC transporter ATP-binding protein [Rhizobiales bacterium]|nr:ABC transporter ATP-binding protein [Hyphomicrobiales bacterium]MBA68961.1 ABC transporter ATP-binding protein [Hyphomicrobiales bacterium]